ncbi:hypothetical protein B0H14DRAFT_2643413 [Mycena olivaceomarginata]|nr:hypothetical protein B0H14DRAFT_2643413 [Mycena olivaceomarginata]
MPYILSPPWNSDTEEKSGVIIPQLMSGPFAIDEKENQQFDVQCWPPVDSLLTAARETDLNFPFTFGLIYHLGGRMVEAQQLLCAYTGKAMEKLGKDHSHTLSAMEDLATCNHN